MSKKVPRLRLMFAISNVFELASVCVCVCLFVCVCVCLFASSHHNCCLQFLFHDELLLTSNDNSSIQSFLFHKCTADNMPAPQCTFNDDWFNEKGSKLSLINRDNRQITGSLL